MSETSWASVAGLVAFLLLNPISLILILATIVDVARIIKDRTP